VIYCHTFRRVVYDCRPFLIYDLFELKIKRFSINIRNRMGIEKFENTYRYLKKHDYSSIAKCWSFLSRHFYFWNCLRVPRRVNGCSQTEQPLVIITQPVRMEAFRARPRPQIARLFLVTRRWRFRLLSSGHWRDDSVPPTLL